MILAKERNSPSVHHSTKWIDETDPAQCCYKLKIWKFEGHGYVFTWSAHSLQLAFSSEAETERLVGF